MSFVFNTDDESETEIKRLANALSRIPFPNLMRSKILSSCWVVASVLRVSLNTEKISIACSAPADVLCIKRSSSKTHCKHFLQPCKTLTSTKWRKVREQRLRIAVEKQASLFMAFRPLVHPDEKYSWRRSTGSLDWWRARVCSTRCVYTGRGEHWFDAKTRHLYYRVQHYANPFSHRTTEQKNRSFDQYIRTSGFSHKSFSEHLFTA